MIITREIQTATVKTYDAAPDEYGQRVLNETTRESQLAVKPYSQMSVADPRYVDVEMIGLTKDTSIAPGEVISLAQGDFRVKYVIPSTRWIQLMLTKVSV